MGIWGSKNKGKVIAVLEFASGSIGGMLIRQNKESKPQVMASARTPVNFLLDINFEAFWRCTRDSFQKTMQKLLQVYPQGPDACLCVFLSPWFISQAKMINIQREKSFEITKDFFEKLLKAEEENFKGREAPRLSPLKGIPDFIEHQVIKVDLNNYHTKSPLGKFAKTVKLYIYMSLGIKEIKEEIKKEVLKNFGDIPLSFVTFPFLAFRILSDIVNTKDGLILVDVGGEITDIFLIKKDFLEETVSFPKGKNFVLRKIASEFNTFPQEAESIFQSYLKGHTIEGRAEKVSRVIKDAESGWCGFFIDGLKTISQSGPLPQNLFLIGEESIGSQFVKCLEEDNLSRFTILGKPFNINKILADSLAHYLDFQDNTAESKDIFLMLESIFANKIL